MGLRTATGFEPTRRARWRRWGWSLVAAVAVALSSVAITPRSACACSTKEPIYRSLMRNDLRQFAEANALFFADSARFGTPEELLSSGEFLWSREGIVFAEFALTPAGFRATVAMPSYTEATCWVHYERSDPASTEPACTPKPKDFNRPLAITYGLALLLAVMGRVLRPVDGRRRFHAMRLIPLAFLTVVHPFWPLPMDGWCRGSLWDTLRLAWLVIVGWYVLRPALFDSDDDATTSTQPSNTAVAP